MNRCLERLGPLLSCLILGCRTTNASQGDGVDAAGPPESGLSILAHPIVVSASSRTARTTTWSVNYADWMPTSGDDVGDTAAVVGALAPAMLRVGGHDSDTSTPDPFDDAALDRAVAYARAMGAEPLVQVPLLRNAAGKPATAATAAAIVTYANVTRGYRIKYFSIGNEPDLYASQGAPGDPTSAAIPNYAPSDYCDAVRPFVAAMKDVDPTIQIVGPDLASHYRPPLADFLSPVLQGCGDLFDVISVHRVPFGAGGGTLDQTAADPASFRGVIASVREILQLSGYGQKPIALTETNLASDPASPATIPAAAPGTVPGALWWADILGASIELELWTAALSVTSDSDDRSLGLVGGPPGRAKRPAYYALELYAEHLGPTLLGVTSAPPGVSVHASRSQGDDATEAVVVNWNVSSTAVALELTGLSPPPPPAVFVLPPLSMSAISVPDQGAPTAWTYADAQHTEGAGLQPLAPVAGEDIAIADAGAPPDASDGEAGPPPPCPGVAPSGAAITVLGGTNGMNLVFGPDSYMWGSFTYAGSGQTAPVLAPTPDGDGMQVTAQLLPTTPDSNYSGVGLYYSSASCLDASAYSGLKFDFAGDLGGCALALGAQPSEDVSTNNDPVRGTCQSLGGACYGPSAPVTPGSGTTVRVPFTALTGGMPVGALDVRTIVSFNWQLSVPASTPDGGPCTADFTVENVALY
jgi:hypothetical protein